MSNFLTLLVAAMAASAQDISSPTIDPLPGPISYSPTDSKAPVNTDSTLESPTGNPTYMPTSSFPTNTPVYITQKPTNTPTISLEPTGPCLGKILKIEMLTDAYPNEISWDLIRTCSQDIVLSSTFFGSMYTDDFTQYSNEYCIEDTRYTFIIKDAYGDGICCLEGNGSYRVFYDGELVAEGGESSTIEGSQEFGIESCSPSPPTTPFPTITPISKPTSFNPQDIETVITCGDTSTDSTVDEEDGKWYRLAEVTGRVTLNTCGSDFDTMLDVYRELGNNYVGGNDDSCGLQSVVEIEAEEGVDYKVHVQ